MARSTSTERTNFGPGNPGGPRTWLRPSLLAWIEKTRGKRLEMCPKARIDKGRKRGSYRKMTATQRTRLALRRWSKRKKRLRLEMEQRREKRLAKLPRINPVMEILVQPGGLKRLDLVVKRILTTMPKHSRRTYRKKAATPPVIKKGRMSKADHAAVEAMILATDPNETEESIAERTQALAIAIRRGQESIRAAVIEARETLHSNARRYAEIHLLAASRAANFGNAAPAQWALEHLTAPAETGKGLERIVEPPPSAAAQGPTGPVVNIGVSLGGVRVPEPPTAARADPALVEGVVVPTDAS